MLVLHGVSPPLLARWRALQDVFVFKSAGCLGAGFLRQHAGCGPGLPLSALRSTLCVYGAFESELLHCIYARVRKSTRNAEKPREYPMEAEVAGSWAGAGRELGGTLGGSWAGAGRELGGTGRGLGGAVRKRRRGQVRAGQAARLMPGRRWTSCRARRRVSLG